MRSTPLQFVLLALCFATPLAAAPRQQDVRRDPQVRQERAEAEKAKGIAAVEVGGEAVAARRIDLNGATGGWEVFVKMPKDEPGWYVVIDRDTWTVRRKTRQGKG